MYADVLVCVRMAAYSETHEYVHFPIRPLGHILILLSLHCRLATFISCGGYQAKILCALLNSPIVPTTLSFTAKILNEENGTWHFVVLYIPLLGQYLIFSAP